MFTCFPNSTNYLPFEKHFVKVELKCFTNQEQEYKYIESFNSFHY